jgi:hypothetical protein
MYIDPMAAVACNPRRFTAPDETRLETDTSAVGHRNASAAPAESPEALDLRFRASLAWALDEYANTLSKLAK